MDKPEFVDKPEDFIGVLAPAYNGVVGYSFDTGRDYVTAGRFSRPFDDLATSILTAKKESNTRECCKRRPIC